MILRVLFQAVPCAFLLAACTSTLTPTPVDEAIASQPDSATAQAPDQAQVVAWVGGQPITVDDVEREMARRSVNVSGHFATIEQRRALLEEMIRIESLVAMARREGYDKQPEIASAFNRILSNKYLQDTLNARQGVVEITREDVERFYQQHRHEYMTPERFRAAMIFVEIRPRYTEEKKADLERRAATALAEAAVLDPQTKGFGDLARKYSDDAASRYVAGMIGWLYRSRAERYKWQPEVVEAIFALEAAGDLSPLIRTERGIYLVKLVEKEEQRPQPLNKVASGIEHRLLKQERTRLRQEFYDGIRRELEIEVNQEMLATVEPPESANRPREDPKQKPPALPGGEGNR